MPNIDIEIPEIPHGHGLSFKKGVADALLECQVHESECHPTHATSYKRGQETGSKLKEVIASHVKA